MKLKLLILLVGLGGGGALMHLYGSQARQVVGLEGRDVEATVLDERRDEDGRLVLMLESEGESMLATFRERADDVASLVNVGDVVSFRAPANGVFSDDVPLLSVRRGTGVSEAAGEDEDTEENESTDEGDEAIAEEGDAESLDEEAEGADGESDSEEAVEDEAAETTDSEEPVPLAEHAAAAETENAES